VQGGCFRFEIFLARALGFPLFFSAAPWFGKSGASCSQGTKTRPLLFFIIAE
jgi:hypothetical protein